MSVFVTNKVYIIKMYDDNDIDHIFIFILYFALYFALF